MCYNRWWRNVFIILVCIEMCMMISNGAFAQFENLSKAQKLSEEKAVNDAEAITQEAFQDAHGSYYLDAETFGKDLKKLLQEGLQDDPYLQDPHIKRKLQE